MVIGLDSGFSTEEKLDFIRTIRHNLTCYLAEIGVQCQRQQGIPTLLPGNKAFADQLIEGSRRAEMEFTQDLVSKSKAFWSDPAVQTIWSRRSTVQVPESTAYFMDRIDIIGREDYVPTDEDILKVRTRTTGILEREFSSDGQKFLLLDVGGQRSERKKWINCFDGVTAVLFLSAINEYDMKVFEDERTNRLDEALNLFEEVSNLPVFAKTTFVLFLNKEDLFREKIKNVPLSTCFKDYTGDNSYEDAAAFIKAKFLARLKNPDRPIVVHLTCATDTAKTLVVFEAVKETIIRQNLMMSGLAVH